MVQSWTSLSAASDPQKQVVHWEARRRKQEKKQDSVLTDFKKECHNRSLS
jgi:hypothetical protein